MTLTEINSEEMKGKRPLAGSVMDYLPTNFKMDHGKIQGDYAMIGVGALRHVGDRIWLHA